MLQTSLINNDWGIPLRLFHLIIITVIYVFILAWKSVNFNVSKEQKNDVQMFLVLR